MRAFAWAWHALCARCAQAQRAELNDFEPIASPTDDRTFITMDSAEATPLEMNALNGYENFFKLPHGSATLGQVKVRTLT